MSTTVKKLHCEGGIDIVVLKVTYGPIDYFRDNLTMFH